MCCATRCCRRITVIATQTGYLIGGLVVVETLFRYQGIGSLIFTAARGKDFPILEAGVPDASASSTPWRPSSPTSSIRVLNPRIRTGAGQ